MQRLPHSWSGSWKSLAEGGIFVVSIDFRMPPVAPHPGSIQDINLSVRWLKANARSFGRRPEWVGSFGTSIGGHQVRSAVMRPTDPVYAILPGLAGVDAGLGPANSRTVMSSPGIDCSSDNAVRQAASRV